MNNFDEQLKIILEKHKVIEKKLSHQHDLDSDKLVSLNKEYSELNPKVEIINEFYSIKNDIQNLKSLLKDQDNSIRTMAEDELKQKNNSLKDFEKNLLKILIPKETKDDKNSILEKRAGTGGDEASLFASDLFSMYLKYSDLNSWRFEILSISETGLKGIKEVICNISGISVFSKLIYFKLCRPKWDQLLIIL